MSLKWQWTGYPVAPVQAAAAVVLTQAALVGLVLAAGETPTAQAVPVASVGAVVQVSATQAVQAATAGAAARAAQAALAVVLLPLSITKD